MKIKNRKSTDRGPSLERKLSSYALAGAAILAAPVAAHAGTITDVPVNQTFTFTNPGPSSGYTLTFQNSTDTISVTAQANGSSNDVDASVLGNALILNALDINANENPAALGNNVVIDPTTGTWGTGGKMASFGVPFDGGNWSLDGGTAFLGFDFTEADGVHVGWAQISTEANAAGSSFTIYDYAYDTVANTTITTPAPEPSTMSLIALGGIGLLALRRRRARNA